MFIVLLLTKGTKLANRAKGPDWSGPGATLGLIFTIAATIAVVEFGQGLPLWSKLIGAPMLGIVSGMLFSHVCAEWTLRLLGNEMSEAARFREEEMTRKLAEAKASGAFDRWNSLDA